MTIAVGIRCENGVIFGADTEETVGDLRRRVFKIPSLREPCCAAIITGACENGHLMDTAIERIFDAIVEDKPSDNRTLGNLLRRVMLKLYAEDFAEYPSEAVRVHLLVAAKLPEESRVEAWSVRSSVVRRMQDKEILGCGELVGHLLERLYRNGMSLNAGALTVVQLLGVAKKRVSGVGGSTYIAALDDKRLHEQNVTFYPELEGLYDFFMDHARHLLLSTGNTRLTDAQFEEIVKEFSKNLSWYRHELKRLGRQLFES
jgi:20S proteasome alpha/beta subunit